ncbi:MAG: GNAT family N-acetyltransferase, partial [candidate division GAL15 bacterium]
GALVQALVARARSAGARTVFALTRAVAFFERQGFRVTDRERFPEKVWRDCVRCPLRDRCDEVAVAMRLDAEAA